ncbi:MAG: cyclic nucleotide-binding domain-containing protein, partial [Xanthomonadales bacterium]|nr:cyclic nucleotide-binding domain-containing protein [Xanthomonadales bacterium]
MGAYLRKAATISARLKRLKKSHYQKLLGKLSVLDLMTCLPPADIRRVVSDIEKRSFSKGDLICHEDLPCDALFLIESGRVEVRGRRPGPVGETPAVLGEGEAFGEFALVSGAPAVTRAEAIEDTVLWEIHKDDFSEVVAVSPGLQKRLARLAGAHRRDLPAERFHPEESRAWLAAARQDIESEVGRPTEAEIMQAASAQKRSGSNVALAIWLGIALDGIPESLIIGSTMDGAAVSIALIGGLFLANFPESMSSAVVMKKQGTSAWFIIGMRASLMIMTAVGAAMGNVFIAATPQHVQALLEGMAAGAMLAMIAQTMLPEAYDHGGWLTGLLTVISFLAAVWMGTLDEERRHAEYLRQRRRAAHQNVTGDNEKRESEYRLQAGK